MGIPATWAGFKTIECCRCATGFAVEAGLYEQRRQDHESFWCPNGHEQHFTGKTVDQRRIEQLEHQVASEQARAKRERHSREWAESRAKGANIQAGKAKAAKRRLEARIARGVCPCCHRTFKQLAAHMKTKHPEQLS
jgi:hypothetical protein